MTVQSMVTTTLSCLSSSPFLSCLHLSIYKMGREARVDEVLNCLLYRRMQKDVSFSLKFFCGFFLPVLLTHSGQTTLFKVYSTVI